MNSNKQLNILYCEGNTDGTIGGSFYSLFYLVSGLDRAKYNPVVVFYYSNSVAEKLEKLNIKTIILRRPKPYISVKRMDRGRSRSFSIPLIFQKAINFTKFHIILSIKYALLLKKYKIDLLHLNNSITKNHEWILAACLGRVRCITHERGINTSFSRLARFYAKKLDAVICISQAVTKGLIDNKVVLRRSVTIYNGIDPERIIADTDEGGIRKLHGIEGDWTIIGVVGNIKKWKGQETAIKAMEHVVRLFPKTMCLLVGDTSEYDKDYLEYLKKLTQKLKLEQHITFTGYIENVANYLNCMKIVLHTSLEPEPFGRVLIEAMAMKKPLIAAWAGAVSEIVKEGSTGFGFPPGDWHSLAEKICKLLADEQLAFKFGTNAYQRLVELFDIKININSTMRLYDELLK
ncbi:glycosyltransferase family 4 protein [Desulfofustis limnaeus]|uniref:Glycosyl transferase group 1 n=1 Tax=Desulfofustis limnaeus TaxID=2740163 RepID=A0ABN6M3X8_9BACT|nr:glycosyltransferase family 4 protein [Desulfofustis limnaeus]BDD87618.1 glycosyl transferase group 1 [Desulfofustis limnaeus]